MRLSVKKAAYADLSRAACRKSGVSPGLASANEQSLRDWFVFQISPQDYVLGYSQPSPFDKLRAGSTGLNLERSCHADCEALSGRILCGTAEAVPFVQ
jgi:hypothetical protein